MISRKAYADSKGLPETTIRGWQDRHWQRGIHFAVIGRVTMIVPEEADRWLESHLALTEEAAACGSVSAGKAYADSKEQPIALEHKPPSFWVNAYDHFDNILGRQQVDEMCFMDDGFWEEGSEYKYIDGVLHIDVRACKLASHRFYLHHTDRTKIAQKRTALYRNYDRTGVLLYVGISLHPDRRLNEHRSTEWFDSIDEIEIEWFDCRKSARCAELKAIRDEHPLYNIAHNAA